MARKFADIGAMMKGKDGSYYIKLDKDVQITVKGKKFNGENIDLQISGGGYINLEKPEDKFNKIFKGDETKIQERLANIPDYIKFLVSASQEV